MSVTTAELFNDGTLKIAGNLNTRLPAITDGLIAHFPFDGTDKSAMTSNILHENFKNENEKIYTGTGYSFYSKTFYFNDILKNQDVKISEDADGDWLYATAEMRIDQVRKNAGGSVSMYFWHSSATDSWMASTSTNSTNINWEKKSIKIKLNNYDPDESGNVADKISFGVYHMPSSINDGESCIRNITIFIDKKNSQYSKLLYISPSINTNTTLTSDGIAVEEATTNLIPESRNRFPSYGNNHGTYNTNQYNNNKDFSIGTVANITNNIVTLATVDHVINTYDVLNPATTGGGVTAGTHYFIKKHSSNSFSLHAYDSSQDGSKGFAVHDSIKNDVRITINATNFPTMWHGAPHLPNSGLVKEIIPNGFKGIHDCIRCHTEHKIEGGTDSMAYGVHPPVTKDKIYTFSFWVRAVTPETLNTNIRLTMHTSPSGWSGGTHVFTDMQWHKYSVTATAPQTGGTNMYFWQSKGTVIDISEIQCEEKSFATSCVDGNREHGELKIPIKIPDGDMTIVCTKQDKFDTEEHTHTLVKIGNNFKYYKDGNITTEYINAQCEYRGKMDSRYPTFDNGSNPFKYGFFERLYPIATGDWDYQSWVDAKWGGYFKYFAYCVSDTSVNINLRGDNTGYWRTNLDDSTIFSVGYKFTTHEFIFKKGWNLIECIWSDGDSGGNVFGNIIEAFNKNNNIKYLTAELPIDLINDNIWCNRYTNTIYKNLSIYNRALLDDEIKTLINSSFNLKSNGDLIVPRLESKPSIPKDAYYFSLSCDALDENKAIQPSEETNLVYEDGSVWVGNETTNFMIDNSKFTGTLITASYDVVSQEWTMVLAANNAQRWRGLSITLNSIIAIPGSKWCQSWEIYSEEKIPMHVDINNFGISFGTGTNDNDILSKRDYSHCNMNTSPREWKKMWTLFEFDKNLTQNFKIQNEIIFNNGFVPDHDVTVKIRNFQVEELPFRTPYTKSSRSKSHLEFNLHESINLDWNSEWSIIYWKKPMGTHSNNLAGYNTESIGCNSNSVGGGYIWFGKSSGNNIIQNATNESGSTSFDPNFYFNHWHTVSLIKKGGIITYKAHNINGKTYTRNITVNTITSNYYVTQYGYDLKLGGWDNNNVCNTFFKDLIVLKRAITNEELNSILNTNMEFVENKTLKLKNKISTNEDLT